MADRLAIQVAGPSKMGINSTQNVASKSFVISIQDSLLNQSTTAGVTVTVSTNVGAVGGTITAATNAFGRAIFNAFTINTLGSQTLTFSAPGFTSVTATVIGTTDPGACVMDDTWFTSTGGGCKDNSTGKVWSLPSASTMTWHDAIWGYVSGTFNLAEPTDGSDSSRTSDYDSDNSQGGSDTSTVNYCHALTEGGQTDWRVPTSAELTTVYRSGAGSNTHFQNFQNNTNYWASTSQNATYAYYWATGSNSISSYLKSSLYNTICVRP